MGIGFTPFTDFQGGETGLLEMAELPGVGLGVSQIVEVRYRDTRQAPVLGLAEHLKGALAKLLGDRPGEGAVQLI